MDYAAAADALTRRKIFESIYDRMTDEERRLFVQMALKTLKDKDGIYDIRKYFNV